MIRVTSRRFSLAHPAHPAHPARAPRAALTALAALILAAASVVLGTGGSALAASNYSLLILPDQGETSIYSFINSATSSIDMTMYELRTPRSNDLVTREKAGVNVRVILDGAEKSVNSTAFSALQAGGVSVTYSSTAFTYTHQKTITVDNRESFISTGNLDSTYYSTSRDYGVFDTDAATSRPSWRYSTPTSRRPRSPRPTGMTWSGRRPTRRPICSP